MKELLERIAVGLVTEPESVHVEEERKGDRVLLRLRVADVDTGKVIGRGGQVARAIRTVMRAAAVQEGVLVRVDIEGKQDSLHSQEAEAQTLRHEAGAVPAGTADHGDHDSDDEGSGDSDDGGDSDGGGDRNSDNGK